MKKHNLVSVIVPNYNNEKYIVQCLESILSQTYPNIEIIIIDDASTDDSKKILKEYEANYAFIKVIFNKRNQGVTKNRDIAISSSYGEFITTLDSDDYFLDNQKIEKEMQIIQQFISQGKVNIIAFSNIVLVDKNGQKLFPNAQNNIKEGNIFHNIFARDCMIPRDFIFTKKQYYNVGGFDSSIPIYEDWDLKIRLSKHNEFYYSGIDGIAYRRHGNGLSSTNSDKHIKWLKAIYVKNYHLINENDKVMIKNGFNHFLKKAFNHSIYQNIVDKFKSIINKGK